eukprot:PhF_6_TR33605/c0_g1_i2/m.49066
MFLRTRLHRANWGWDRLMKLEETFASLAKTAKTNASPLHRALAEEEKEKEKAAQQQKQTQQQQQDVDDTSSPKDIPTIKEEEKPKVDWKDTLRSKLPTVEIPKQYTTYVSDTLTTAQRHVTTAATTTQKTVSSSFASGTAIAQETATNVKETAAKTVVDLYGATSKLSETVTATKTQTQESFNRIHRVYQWITFLWKQKWKILMGVAALGILFVFGKIARDFLSITRAAREVKKIYDFVQNEPALKGDQQAFEKQQELTIPTPSTPPPPKP